MATISSQYQHAEGPRAWGKGELVKSGGCAVQTSTYTWAREREMLFAPRSVWFVALRPVLTLGNLVITSDSLHLVFV